jgi:hypothetical protein
MRHQYTPIFRDLLDSSLWATATPAARCVWITFLLDADPEGCIPTSVPGLARRANVTVDEARAAIAMLEAPDPDSRTPDFEGRRVAKIAGGWQVLNFVAKRELAKHEAEKARKRKWATANGKRPPANDNDDASSTSALASNLDASSETLDAPKPKPKPKPKPSPSEGRSPLPPVRSDFIDGSFSTTDVVEAMGTLPVFNAPTLPAVIRKLSEWVPKPGELEALRAAATMAGVKDFDRWFAQLGSGPIGGARGVLPDMVGDYLHGQFSRWRKWEETDAFNDANSRAAPPSRGFRGEPLPPQGPQRERVPGAPAWVYVEHLAFAKQHGMKLGAAAKAFAETYYLGNPSDFPSCDIFDPFMKFLQERAAAKESA